ncbi:hypothetical protein BGW38_010757 [Lunasporangiospora selenospora]|uniref:Acyl dehydratase n=1 Tax=Lunasporangiospora selenospora TaxID=979761 RepID=A0A9P6KFI0_9FUNG|nr:hypothetical protein BGW38_010757 [Lunasporangiospora selenospora]
MSAPSTPPAVNVDKAVGFQLQPLRVAYNARDLMLYALSIGVKQDELHFLYESEPGFAAFPTYPVVLGLKRDNVGVSVYGADSEPIPGIPDFDPNRLGKGMVIERTTLMVDPREPNRPYCSMKAGVFVRGYGGFGGPKGPKAASNEPPKDRLATPDAVVEDQTSDELAILYRLSGDYNPLHIDPKIAPRVGFKKPILHGLCTYGHAAHAVLKALGRSDPRALRSITGRFTSPVYPGDTLVTRMWKVPGENKDQTKVVFQTLAKERDQIVINGGCVELWNEDALARQSKL